MKTRNFSQVTLSIFRRGGEGNSTPGRESGKSCGEVSRRIYKRDDIYRLDRSPADHFVRRKSIPPPN
jgi:hypothetical protein